MHDDATEKLITSVRCDPVESARVRVTFLEGPDAGTSHVIDDASHRRALVGKSVACDVRLSDPTVSRRHASIELAPEGIRLLDLGSRNGTFANGLRIKEVFLGSGDVVALGSTSIRIEIESESHPLPAWSEPRFHRVLGASPEMRRLYPLFERIASRAQHVLLEGETGTGKELVAEALHDAQGRPDAPFVVFDPGGFRPEDLERELFEPGADAPSLIDQARGGTLYIDEIADLPSGAQMRLLRVIEGKARGLGGIAAPITGGGTSSLPVRIIAGTRTNLDEAIQERRFREELYVALATPRVELPPLRKRTGDIVFLTQCFWTALGGAARDLPPDLVHRFTLHDWPGNVRELYYAVSLVLASGREALDLRARKPTAVAGVAPDFMSEVIARELPFTRARQEVTLEFERRYVQTMLEKNGNHVGRAAKASGVGRRYFQMIRAKK